MRHQKNKISACGSPTVSVRRRHLMTPLLQGYVSRDEMMIRLEKIRIIISSLVWSMIFRKTGFHFSGSRSIRRLQPVRRSACCSRGRRGHRAASGRPGNDAHRSTRRTGKSATGALTCGTRCSRPGADPRALHGDVGEVDRHQLADFRAAIDAGDQLQIDLGLGQRGVRRSPLPAIAPCL